MKTNDISRLKLTNEKFICNDVGRKKLTIIYNKISKKNNNQVTIMSEYFDFSEIIHIFLYKIESIDENIAASQAKIIIINNRIIIN